MGTFGYGYDQQTENSGPKQKIKRQIAYRRWAAVNIFSVATIIEMKSGYLVDTVFFEMGEMKNSGYDKKGRIAMQVNTTELRAFGHACKEIVFKGETSYKPFTDPSLSGFGRGGAKKSLSLGRDKEGRLYINMQEGERVIAAVFPEQKLLAIADQVTLMAEITEKALYTTQMKLAQ